MVVLGVAIMNVISYSGNFDLTVYNCNSIRRYLINRFCHCLVYCSGNIFSVLVKGLLALLWFSTQILYF